MSTVQPAAQIPTEYDAIVIGSGISGGWAAKELCERGLKTLLLERGRNLRHIQDYETAYKSPWEIPYGGDLSRDDSRRLHVQSRSRLINQGNKHFWVDDLEHPYIEEKPFTWIRGYHLGGRSLMWSRQSFRWSDLDFTANQRDGAGVDWPIRYRDVEPWYDYVERYIGVSGRKEGLAQLPDGQFLPPMEMNCVEQHLGDTLRSKFRDRILTIGRPANLTQGHNGRGQCMYRNLCNRGCPFGAYFSTLSSTLPAAQATGNLTLRPHSVVSHLLYDDRLGKATGVAVIDAETKQALEFRSKIIFVNASTLGSTAILLNSKSARFPNGLGNDSGELGHNLMDHHYAAGAAGEHEGFQDRYYSGRRPTSIYVPRFRNIKEKHPNYVRGFGYQGRASRDDWTRHLGELSVGPPLKNALGEPGKWSMGLVGFGEFLPHHDNRVVLSADKTDRYGLPLLSINCQLRDNEWKMREDMKASAAEMLEAAGFTNVRQVQGDPTPGIGIHEMGTARMGRDPKTSVLNGHNQVHAVKNVFVTDGAMMASSACQNPSLTYMALTARAAAFAVEALKRKEL
jgi:choline dehydrogenase-like flavoprotein